MNPFVVNFTKRRISSFSPITAICELSSSLTVLEVSRAHFSARKPSRSAAFEEAACLTTLATKVLNFSFFATKSVSELTSTTAAHFLSSLTYVSQTPSAAIRLAFFSAAARPFLRKNSIASSKLPLVYVRAFLQSIIPAPVFSLKSFTMLAVISAMSISS